MRGFGLTPILLVVPCSALLGHPHAKVDQQVHLSIGLTNIVATFYLAPSNRDGGHMFNHIDTDRNGVVDNSEKDAFASAILKDTALAANGYRKPFKLSHSAFPDKATMKAGGGVIRLKAQAQVNFERKGRRRLSLAVNYKRFARRWAIQPFFFDNLGVKAAGAIVNRDQPRNLMSLEF